MADCNHDCSNCSQANCADRIEKAKLNDKSHIKKIVGVLSGKGGVGKSYITSLLAVYLNRQGYKVGIMDADITGPSIPKAFGVKDKAYGEDGLIYPLESHSRTSGLRTSASMESPPIGARLTSPRTRLFLWAPVWGQTLASTRKGMCFGGIWQINESYPALRFVDTFYAIYSCI